MVVQPLILRPRGDDCVRGTDALCRRLHRLLALLQPHRGRGQGLLEFCPLLYASGLALLHVGPDQVQDALLYFILVLSDALASVGQGLQTWLRDVADVALMREIPSGDRGPPAGRFLSTKTPPQEHKA